MLDITASADNLLGSHGRFGCVVSSLSPETGIRDMHVCHFRLSGPSSVTIARSERPDYRGYNIRTHTVRLRLNIRFQTCKFRRGTVW